MNKLVIIVCCAGALAGCTTGPAPDLEMANRHLNHCAEEAGIVAPFATSVRVVGAEIEQSIPPGNGVSQAQSDAVNACLAL